MTQDTEALERQVRTLTAERDKARRELNDAYTAISHAGVKAREMRADINRLNNDVRTMAAALAGTLKVPTLPAAVRKAAVDALGGSYE